MFRKTFLALLMISLFASCTKSTTSKKSSSSSSSSGSSSQTGSGGNSGGSSNNGGGNSSSDIQSCGALTGNTEVDNYCFRTVTPTAKVHGLSSLGNVSWQSSLHATIPQSYFESDLKFYVRVVPKPVDFTESTNGSLVTRRCNPTTVDNNQNKYRYSKLRVTLEVKKKGSTYSGDVKTIDAVLNPGSLTPSSRFRFNTSGPGEYDIIVKDVKTNHRCSNWGMGDLNCSTYQDLPYVTNTNYPTDCVAFEVQFSTDYTRDLP